jgi:hypothetical protein
MNAEKILLTNVDIAAPVKLLWLRLEEREKYLTEQNKLNTFVINNTQTQDLKFDVINFINYTWEQLRYYKVPADVIEMFKTKLTNVYKLHITS